MRNGNENPYSVIEIESMRATPNCSKRNENNQTKREQSNENNQTKVKEKLIHVDDLELRQKPHGVDSAYAIVAWSSVETFLTPA